MPLVDPSKIEFVLRTVPMPLALRESLAPSAVSGFLSDQDAEHLGTICSERFNTHGFNANLELNGEGRILDDLIHELLLD